MTNIQAIDLLKDLEQRLDDYCELNDEGKTAFRMAIEALEVFGNSEQLPPAQPDIIRCRDCKHWRSNTEFCSTFTELNVAHRMPPNGFCSCAEKREE